MEFEKLVNEVKMAIEIDICYLLYYSDGKTLGLMEHWVTNQSGYRRYNEKKRKGENK